jgi:hypothetical protein
LGGSFSCCSEYDAVRAWVRFLRLCD